MSDAAIDFNKISPAITLTPEACTRLNQQIGPGGTAYGDKNKFFSTPDIWLQLLLYVRGGNPNHERDVVHILCGFLQEDVGEDNKLTQSQLLEVVGSFQDDSNKVAVLSMPGFMNDVSLTDKALRMQLVDVLIKMTEEGRKALFAANLGNRDRTALNEMHKYVLGYQTGPDVGRS